MTKTRDLLVEEAAGSHRPTRAGSVGSHPAWHDLDAQGRKDAFELAMLQRQLEAACDPEGLSGTARAVLAKIIAAS